jgi:hypothetical protein
MASNKARLQELRGSNYELGKGQPDIRGWEVRNEHGQKIGRVRELIFDAAAGKVRYMVVDIRDHRELDLDKRTVLIPIGLADLHQHDDDVVLHHVTPFQLRALPSYRKEDLGTKAELAISTVFGRTYASNAQESENLNQNFYQHEHFNDDRIQSRKRNVEEPVRSERNGISNSEAESLRKDIELGQPLPGADPKDVHERNERLQDDRDLLGRKRRRNDG